MWTFDSHHNSSKKLIKLNAFTSSLQVFQIMLFSLVFHYFLLCYFEFNSRGERYKRLLDIDLFLQLAGLKVLASALTKLTWSKRLFRGQLGFSNRSPEPSLSTGSWRKCELLMAREWGCFSVVCLYRFVVLLLRACFKVSVFTKETNAFIFNQQGVLIMSIMFGPCLEEDMYHLVNSKSIFVLVFEAAYIGTIRPRMEILSLLTHPLLFQSRNTIWLQHTNGVCGQSH